MLLDDRVAFAADRLAGLERHLEGAEGEIVRRADEDSATAAVELDEGLDRRLGDDAIADRADAAGVQLQLQRLTDARRLVADRIEDQLLLFGQCAAADRVGLLDPDGHRLAGAAGAVTGGEGHLDRLRDLPLVIGEQAEEARVGQEVGVVRHARRRNRHRIAVGIGRGDAEQHVAAEHGDLVGDRRQHRRLIGGRRRRGPRRRRGRRVRRLRIVVVTAAGDQRDAGEQHRQQRDVVRGMPRAHRSTQCDPKSCHADTPSFPPNTTARRQPCPR